MLRGSGSGTITNPCGKLVFAGIFQSQPLLLLGAFAVLTLALSSVGIYGVMAFAVSRRTAELGLRFALGASRSAVLTMVVTQGMKLILSGTAAGILMSLALSGVLRTLLFGVSPTDPFTLGGTAVLLAAVGTIAVIIPARRALRVDPMIALRVE